MNEGKYKKIEIEEIIGNKNPGLLKLLPSLVIKYLKRIIHQNELNDFLEKNANTFGIDFATEVLKEINIETIAVGIENIPEQEGCIIAANHPLGGLDAMALIHTLGKKRKDMKFLVNDILMSLKNLNPLFLPINKHGKNTKEGLLEIEKTFSSDQLLLVFPAGLVSRKQNGVIKDLEWKKTFITQSKKFNKKVIPVHIEGYNSPRFYNLAIWRKKLGIKANIEMIFLVDELFRQRDKKIKITFGKPIEPSSFNQSKTDKEWAAFVKEEVYKLAKYSQPLNS